MQPTRPSDTDVATAASAPSGGVGTRKLAADVRTLINDAEEFLRNAGSSSGAAFEQARAKFEERVRRIKARIPEAQAAASGKYREAIAAADEYVHANPWQVIGIAAAVGVLVGYLVTRR